MTQLAALAITFQWDPFVLERLDCDQVRFWYDVAQRVQKAKSRG